MTICLHPLAQIHYLFTIPRECCSPVTTTKLLPTPTPTHCHPPRSPPIHALGHTNPSKWNPSENLQGSAKGRERAEILAQTLSSGITAQESSLFIHKMNSLCPWSCPLKYSGKSAHLLIGKLARKQWNFLS